MPKIERKYLAHYIDASFGSGSPNYVRLGKDLEEFNEELNPDVEVKKNIIGEQTVNHNGYEVQSEVDPYYADLDDPLFNQLSMIANERLTGDACKTTKVDVLVNESGTVIWAYREDVNVIPSSFGGDTSGVQIPFTVYNCGNRVSGAWNTGSKTFTPGGTNADATLSALALGSVSISPVFSKSVTTYTATTSNATNTISATATDTVNATIAISCGGNTVTNGSAITWSAGSNVVTVTVTNGTATKTYTITVTKE